MTVEERITAYLSAGGLFNPELMEHDKVRDLLLDCQKQLDAAVAALKAVRSQCQTKGRATIDAALAKDALATLTNDKE